MDSIDSHSSIMAVVFSGTFGCQCGSHPSADPSWSRLWEHPFAFQETTFLAPSGSFLGRRSSSHGNKNTFHAPRLDLRRRQSRLSAPQGSAFSAPRPTLACSQAALSALPPLARLRKLVQQIKKASAYNEAMGAELGILTPTAAARDPKPTKVHVEAGENSHVMIDCALRGWDAVEIESQRGTGGWELLAVCLKRKYTDTRPPLNAGLPEVRSYRLRYRDGDQPQEVYSDVVKATTKP